jgi:hypothetical protein
MEHRRFRMRSIYMEDAREIYIYEEKAGTILQNEACDFFRKLQEQDM